jgi:hypothetical protein
MEGKGEETAASWEDRKDFRVDIEKKWEGMRNKRRKQRKTRMLQARKNGGNEPF